jgi:hypothetical protein
VSAADSERRTIWIADADRRVEPLSLSTAKSGQHFADYDEQLWPASFNVFKMQSP